MLTIVLTVYNKAPYLVRALESLLSQKGTKEGDYEILIVNDGSTDESPKIIDEYAARDSKIRVLTQQNQGLSMARNNGTNVAIGDYVWYVDADDYFSPYAVKLILEAAIAQPDIIPIYAQTEGESRLRNVIPVTAKSGKDVLLSGQWEACGVFNIFRIDFLKKNRLSFLPGIYHEDSEFTPRMLYMAKSVQVIPQVLYYVYREPNSITQVPRPQRSFDYLVVAESLNSFRNSVVKGDEAINKIFLDYICSELNNALNIIMKNSNEEQRRFNSLLREKSDLIDVLKHASSFKYRLEGHIFGVWGGNYSFVYKLLTRFK